MPPLDAKTVVKLGKVWAKRGSSYEGEVRAAEHLAGQIVKPFGYTLADVPGLLKAAERAAAPPPNSQGPGGFKFYDMGDPVQAAAAATAREEQERRKRRAEAPKRAAVIRRYGSLEKVRAWQPKEVLLRAAVQKWSTLAGGEPDGRTLSIDGVTVNSYMLAESVPKRVLSALSAAYPLPATITEALAEVEYWTTRHQDLKLVADFEGDQYLDLPCIIRWDIVERLLETDLRASSIAETLLRFRYLMNQDQPKFEEAEETVIKDLEHFAALERAATVHFGHSSEAQYAASSRTARERRAEVKKLLSNLDTKNLSDREIARRVGVSPQTVGNIRRRMQ
jgi:transcriptional regulator with XRE-family HTH domain